MLFCFFSKARDTDNHLSRVIWLLLFVLCGAMTTYGVYAAIEDFQSWPSVTSIILQHNDKVEFPAVTICNLNRVHCSHLYNMILQCEEDVSSNVGIKQILLTNSKR